MVDGTLEYEVELILSHRKRKIGGKKNPREVTQFLVKWEGYGYEHNTWESEDNLVRNSLECIQDYWARENAGSLTHELS